MSDFGIPQEEVDYQFNIGQRFFHQLSDEERLQYKADHKAASYNGYNGPLVFSSVTLIKTHHDDSDETARGRMPMIRDTTLRAVIVNLEL